MLELEEIYEGMKLTLATADALADMDADKIVVKEVLCDGYHLLVFFEPLKIDADQTDLRVLEILELEDPEAEDSNPTQQIKVGSVIAVPVESHDPKIIYPGSVQDFTPEDGSGRVLIGRVRQAMVSGNYIMDVIYEVPPHVADIAYSTYH